MKIPDAALLFAATEQERLGWIRHLKRMSDEYRKETTTLGYLDIITDSERQVRMRKLREI